MISTGTVGHAAKLRMLERDGLAAREDAGVAHRFARSAHCCRRHTMVIEER